MKRAKVITVAALFLALTFTSLTAKAASTPTPVATRTPSPTPDQNVTPTPSITPSPSVTPTLTPAGYQTATPTPVPSATPVPAVWVYWAGETNANGVYCHDGDFNGQNRYRNNVYPQREVVYGLPIGYWTIVDGNERLYNAADSDPANVDFDALSWTVAEFGVSPAPETADIDCTGTPDPTPDQNVTPTPSITPSPSVTPTLTPAGYQTATPTPVPSATPVGYPTPPIELRQEKISLYYDFATQTGIVDQKLYHWQTGKEYTTRPGHQLMITNIDWSCASATTGTLEWDKTTDERVDRVHFISGGQGKVSGPFDPPKQTDPGTSLILTLQQATTGTVQVEGYLKP